MTKLCVSVCGLAVLLALHCAVEAQNSRPRGGPQAKAGVKAKAKSNPRQKHPMRPKRLIHPKGVFGPKAAVGTQLLYQGAAVNREGGNPLNDFDGQPLRASQIRVWVTRVIWRDGSGRPDLRTPSGLGGSASTAFVYPGFHVDGIVVNQPGGITQNIEATTQAGAQVFQVSNGADLIANVNDLRGSYLDNSGDFDFIVEILQQ